MSDQDSNEFKDRLTERSLTLSKSLCMLAAAIALLAAAGWIFKIELLIKIHPAFQAMMPNTALALVLSAIAITFTGDNRRSGKGRLVACAMAAVVSFLGLLTLGEYIFSWNLGIDRIFISDTAFTAGRLPGRSSPQTAANFALLGAALLVYNSRALSIRIGQVCALVVGANAIVAMTGYIFSTSHFYGFPSITTNIGMAIHTAVSFILLALALLCSRPNDGMMSLVTSDTRSGGMARRILLAGILAPPMVGALTRIGVYANWYDVSVQASLFAVVIAALVLQTTWRAARQSEQDELRARAALDESQTANEQLQKAHDERRIFEALIENSSDFIGIADPTGKPVYVSPAGRRMVGLPDDYPVEDTQILEYYPPDQRAFASDVILRSMVEHGRWQGETNFRHWQTQEAIPVSDEHFMIRDPGTDRLLGMGTVTRDISDVRRSQAELRQSEERLALALRGADLGSWDWNIKTGEVTFSPRWAEMRGFRPEEIKPHVDSWSSGVHPDDRPHVQKTLNNYFQGLVPEYEVEFRVLTKSGDWIWVLDRGKVFARDEKGYPLRMVGTELDITKRKLSEEALHESQERFRLTIDEAPIGMALVAVDGRFVRVNRALCEIVGYSSDELTGLTFQAITHPDDLDADLALAGQLARGEIPRYHLDKRYIRKDGTIVDIQLDCSILRNREGAPLYYIAQIEDITDRKRAEAALKDSERRLALALDSAQIGMWDLDLLTDTSVRSLRHDQIFGYSAAVPTWGAAIFMNHVVPEDREVAKRAFEKAFASDNFDMECRILWSDKSIHWISAKGRVYRNPKGDAVRMMGTVLDITERKRAEEALQRSEREFRELAESMPQIVWATTADGWNIYFNQQWVDYTGITLEESSGEGWITPFHPDDRQRAWDAWQRATQHHDTYSLECRLRRADGVYRWWLIRGVPLLSANGEISKWFGTCTDIEQIKIAEQRLKESEAKFSGIISISADAIISIDEEQRITLFNNGAEQVFGYSKAEVIGTPLDILIPERFRKTHRRHVEEFASGPATARRVGERLTTIAGLRKNGEEFPAEATISKLQVGDKTLLTVALRDITERKRFEKEQQLLAEAGALLAASLDYDQTLATVAHLVVRDFADWCMIEVSDEHQQILRLKVVGGDPSKADVCALLERIRIDRDRPSLLRAVFETKQALLIEHVTSEHLESVAQGPEHLQALHALSPTSLMALPLLRHERLLGALAFISSTASRHYGRSDLRLAEALAERAAVAIENARLYRASVHATQLRDQVLGVVAHDLRSPLSNILMQASVVKRHDSEPERRSQKPMEVIERAARRMNRLIQDLLDVALMEANQLTIKRARLSAGGLIAEAVEMHRSLASASSLELRVEVDPDLPEVWGDWDRLLQVFENLIGNAIKFTRAGGRITAGAAPRDDEVVFWVADTGDGIASENLPRIFDRFWQASRAGRGGAGLGLSITKGIIEAHGGRIWVESIAGSGSTFFFTIPRVSAAQDKLSNGRRPDRAA